MVDERRVWQLTVCVLTMLGMTSLLFAGCARLPYTTEVVYEGSLVHVVLQHEVKPAGYSHPVQLTAQEVAAILRGFSLRAEQRLPLRWFAEEAPPKKLFREDEILLLSSYLVDGLRAAGPDERVHFQLSAPGMNLADSRNVTAGWMAIKEPYLYLSIDYFHTEIPIRKVDNYYQNNPVVPPLPSTYLLFFEPGRFWITDQQGTRGLDYRPFLKAVSTNGAPGSSSP